MQLFAFSHVFINLFLQCLEYFIITSRSPPGPALHRALLICTQPFQQARSPTHSPPGSSLVSLPNLSHSQTLPNPQDLTQIPNPNYSSLATRQAISSLPRTYPAYSLSHGSLPCCVHPFYSAKSTPTFQAWTRRHILDIRPLPFAHLTSLHPSYFQPLGPSLLPQPTLSIQTSC